MREALLALAEEAITVAFEAALFGVLTTVGVISEQFALADLTSGEMLGLWYLFMGALALYAGVYIVGYERLIPRLSGVLSRT
ncbi:MAG: hypothetical protein V5A39_09825 [Haloarculaceae archaeon]